MSAWVFLLLGGMDSIVFGPIRWCVWSFRPSSPLRLPHLKFFCFCSPAGDLFAGATICRVRSWMSAWVFLLLGGMDSIVFGPIRWCVWSFRLSSPLRLPHLKFLFVCLFARLCMHAFDTHKTLQSDSGSKSPVSYICLTPNTH